MDKRKKTIITLTVILTVFILITVGTIAYYFPYNVPIRGKSMYEIAHSNARFNRYYFCDYGFFQKFVSGNIPQRVTDLTD